MIIQQMLGQSGCTGEFSGAFHAHVDYPMLHHMFQQKPTPTGDVATQPACIEIGAHVTYVVHEHVSVTVRLLFELSLADVTLMQNSRPFVVLALKFLQILFPGWRLAMLSSHMVDQRFVRAVIVVTETAFMPL